MRHPLDYWFDEFHAPRVEGLEDFLEAASAGDLENARAILETKQIDLWLKKLFEALLLEMEGDMSRALKSIENLDEKNFWILYNRLRFYTAMGAFDVADECEADLMKMELGREQMLRVQNERGKRMWKKSRYGEAMDNFTAVLEGAMELGDRGLEGNAYNNISLALLATGDYLPAKDLLTKALEAYASVDDVRGMAVTELNLGECCRMMGDWETAREFFNNCISSCQDLDGYTKERTGADCHWNLGQISFMENDLEGARTEYEKALEWGEKTSDEELMTRVDLSMALVSLEQRRIDEAQDWVEKAYKSARAIGSKKYEAESYAMRGRIQEKQKRYDFALQSYGLATFLFRQINDRYNMAKMEEAAGNIYMIQGDKERAIEYLRKAKAKYASLSYTDFRTIDEKLKKAEEI